MAEQPWQIKLEYLALTRDEKNKAEVLIPLRFTTVGERVLFLRGSAEEAISRMRSLLNSQPGGLSDEWDGHLFYSPYLARKLGASTPFDQAGLFASSLLGIGYLISSSYRSYHVIKASSFPINSDDRDYHKYLGNVTEEGLKSARAFAQRIKTKGFLGFLAAPTLWMTYVFIKHPKS